jgi:hypothetical protein
MISVCNLHAILQIVYMTDAGDISCIQYKMSLKEA